MYQHGDIAPVVTEMIISLLGVFGVLGPMVRFRCACICVRVSSFTYTYANMHVSTAILQRHECILCNKVAKPIWEKWEK